MLAPAAVEEDAKQARLSHHDETAVDRGRLRRAAPPATARADGRRLVRVRAMLGSVVRVRVGVGGGGGGGVRVGVRVPSPARPR